jgi:hypothetical protein
MKIKIFYKVNPGGTSPVRLVPQWGFEGRSPSTILFFLVRVLRTKGRVFEPLFFEEKEGRENQ